VLLGLAGWACTTCEYGWRWLLVDVIWGTAGGLGIGFVIGVGVARGVRALALARGRRLDRRVPVAGCDRFSYGVALAARTLIRGVRRGALCGVPAICTRVRAARQSTHLRGV
jgi:hypothetical protein